MRLVRLISAIMLVFCLSVLAWAQQSEDSQKRSAAIPDPAKPSEPQAASDLISSELISLVPGEVKSMAVDRINRVAVANPAVVDVAIASPNEVLLQAKGFGSTNLIIWDKKGQRSFQIQVIDRSPEEQENQMLDLMAQMNITGVNIKRQNGNIFMLGEVPDNETLKRLDQMASTFSGVVNLVRVSVVPSTVIEAPPLVRLAVQVIEINRRDFEELGIGWDDAITLTQPEETGLTLGEAITSRWGQDLTRSSLSATLNALVEKNKARILAEPKLVTVSGKAASSFVGLDIPIVTSSTTGVETGAISTSIEFKKTGVVLKITPVVLSDNRITTTLEAEVSGLDAGSGLNLPVGNGDTVLVPGFKVRKADTEVTTSSGESIVIAGLLESEDSSTMAGIPGLSNMPVVGRLFRSPEVENTQRELVITVTPELVDLEYGSTESRNFALESALASAEVSSSVDDPKMRYALQIQGRIASNIAYPQREKELRMGGTVKLKLHIFSDGTLGRALVSESSGIEALDTAALKAAETQAPYPAFPSQLNQTDIWLDVPVIFQL